MKAPETRRVYTTVRGRYVRVAPVLPAFFSTASPDAARPYRNRPTLCVCETRSRVITRRDFERPSWWCGDCYGYICQDATSIALATHYWGCAHYPRSGEPPVTQ